MANDIYSVDILVPNALTLTVTDDGLGDDWIEITAASTEVTDIRLSWSVSLGTSVSASGAYFDAFNLQHRLIVNGLIENARGSPSRDFIQGNEAGNILFGDPEETGLGLADTIWGGAGDDTIMAGSGDDAVTGDEDNDVLFGNGGNDTLSGGGGVDTVEGGIGADSMSGGATVGDTVSYSTSSAGVTISLTFGDFTQGVGGDAQGDTLFGFTDITGSDFDDVLTDTVTGTVAFGGNGNNFDGGAGNDQLTLAGGDDTGTGGLGGDRLFGGAGNDALYGGNGRDRLDGGQGADILDGGAGTDTLNGGGGNDSYTVDSTGDLVVEAAGAGRDLVNASADWTLTAALEDLTLTGAAVIGSGNAGANILTGNANANTLTGLDGNDTLYGGLGSDSLFGGLGDDVLVGQTGNDTMAGGDGSDRYVCDSSADIIVENGASGRDTVISGVNWTLGSTLENLTLTGAAIQGNGNAQANVLTGNANANMLRGFSGADTIHGGDGFDTIDGGQGNDILIGGKGRDTLTGGAGADHFEFLTVQEMTEGIGDEITDFNHLDGDLIDLSAIDARAGVAGNQTFSFIGEAAFSQQKGELRIVFSPGGTDVQGDINGDGIADFRLQLGAVSAPLSDTDFTL